MSCLLFVCISCVFFFFKQKTAYEMRISDWSSDVCSSDLIFVVNGGDIRQPQESPGLRRSAVDVHAYLHNLLPFAAPSLYNASCRNKGNQGKFFDGWHGCARPRKRHYAVPWTRSDERRVGQECVSTCRSRWSQFPKKKKKTTHQNS